MRMLETKILIVLKKRQDYDEEKHSHLGLSTGLYNSAMFIHDMFNEYNIKSKLVVVDDNNDIDREVSKYKPTYVIIEALWVVPHKFHILCRLHPQVKWIIRLHSQLPFIANEGMAMDWIADYTKFPNIIIAANSDRMLEEMRFYLQTRRGWTDNETEEKVIYLPNYYPRHCKEHWHNKNKDIILVAKVLSII